MSSSPDAPPPKLERSAFTGLVLSGGEGRRMGGADKGLLMWNGRTLVEQALARLAPQVGSLLVSANRNVERYADLARAYRAQVCQDADGNSSDLEFRGPLAGILAGLQACRTPYLAVVPCDAPLLPMDLVIRLANAVGAGSGGAATVPAASYVVHAGRTHPTFCLLTQELGSGLREDLAQGQRKLQTWLDRQGAMPVEFADGTGLVNLNSPQDWARLQQGSG